MSEYSNINEAVHQKDRYVSPFDVVAELNRLASELDAAKTEALRYGAQYVEMKRRHEEVMKDAAKWKGLYEKAWAYISDLNGPYTIRKTNALSELKQARREAGLENAKKGDSNA